MMNARCRPTLTREQRDAIREHLVLQLRSDAEDFGDSLAEFKKYEEARRFRDQFEADSALLDDVGWAADDPRDSFELTQSPALLRSIVDRLLEEAKTVLFSHALGFLKGLDDDADKRAVIIGRACIEIRDVIAEYQP